MCYSPISMRHEEQIVSVPCNKCYECLQRRRSDWTYRIMQEYKNCQSAIFLTLTYSDTEIPYYRGYDVQQKPQVSKRDVQTFMKKLRKENLKYTKSKIKYYAASEYGEKYGRPHYHIILFNVHFKTQKVIEEKIWKKGMIYIGSVTYQSVHYTTGYIMQKQFIAEDLEKTFSLMSKGIGKSYLTEEMRKYHLAKDYLCSTGSGKYIPMPKYYKEKMFSKVHRQILGAKSSEESIKNQLELQRKVEKKGKDYYQFIKRLQDARTKTMQKKSKNSKL